MYGICYYGNVACFFATAVVTMASLPITLVIQSHPIERLRHRHRFSPIQSSLRGGLYLVMHRWINRGDWTSWTATICIAYICRDSSCLAGFGPTTSATTTSHVPSTTIIIKASTFQVCKKWALQLPLPYSSHWGVHIYPSQPPPPPPRKYTRLHITHGILWHCRWRNYYRGEPVNWYGLLNQHHHSLPAIIWNQIRTSLPNFSSKLQLWYW